MDEKKIEAARRAKKRFSETAPVDLDIVGVGIGLSGGDPAVKVNLRKPPADLNALPKSIDGVPIVYDVTGKITPR
jgi:hypothetical protein